MLAPVGHDLCNGYGQTFAITVVNDTGSHPTVSGQLLFFCVSAVREIFKLNSVNRMLGRGVCIDFNVTLSTHTL